MKRKNTAALLLLFVFSSLTSIAQKEVLYKKVDTTSLFMEIYSPKQVQTSKPHPAMVFFFGGGWKGGSRTQFLNHAKYFSQRGIVCFLADYRIADPHRTTPFQSLEDAKSAMRFVRKNATDFNIDPTKIIAVGGSAGGHLAAATATITEYDAPSDDLSISCIPNALVLFNPVIDNGPGGYGYERIGEAYKNFSPLHNLKKGTPPTVFFLGTEDVLIPVETAQYHKTVMEKVGSTCELYLYEGQGHGFFNYSKFDNYKKTVAQTDRFLQGLGYLTSKPIVKIE